MGQPLLLAAKYRNRLEASVGEQLTRAGIDFDYEGEKIAYSVPARKASYLYDIRPRRTRILIETKGYFGRSAKDRNKYLLIRDSNPDYDIRFVFSDANKKIYKGSPTTYGQWATTHGFLWSTKGVVPQEWIDDIKKEQRQCMPRKR